MTTNTTNATNATNDFLEKGVCLSLQLRKLGNRRKISATEVADPEKEFDRSMIGVSKHLLDCKEYRDIGNFDSETKHWLYAHSLPCAFTGRGGTYVIPTDLFLTVYDRLTERSVQRKELVEKFAAVYADKVTEAEVKLGPLFDSSDYLPVDDAMAQFEMSWLVIEFKTPKALAAMRKDIFDREKNKAAAQWRSIAEDAKDALRIGFAKLVEHMTERLGDPQKTFKDTLVNNLREYLETFPSLNSVTNDDQLQAEVKKAADLLAGVSPDDLRDYKDVRTKVLSGMKQIEAQLDTMIVNKPKRRIQVDETAAA